MIFSLLFPQTGSQTGSLRKRQSFTGNSFCGRVCVLMLPHLLSPIQTPHCFIHAKKCLNLGILRLQRPLKQIYRVSLSSENIFSYYSLLGSNRIIMFLTSKSPSLIKQHFVFSRTICNYQNNFTNQAQFGTNI